MRARIRFVGFIVFTVAASLSLIAYTQNPTGGQAEASDRQAPAAAAQNAGGVTEIPADKSAGAVQSYGIYIGQSDSPVVQKIEKVLRSPLPSPGLEYIEQPLNVVVKNLQERLAIPIMLDEQALNIAAIRPDEPVSVDVSDVSLRSALRQLLRDLTLTYIIEDEVLLILTPEAADRRLSICVYDVRDLVDIEQVKSLDDLAEALNEAMEKSNVGQPSIRAVHPGTLVATCSQLSRQTLDELLATIREMNGKPSEQVVTSEKDSARNLTGQIRPSHAFCKRVGQSDSPAIQKIEKTLLSPLHPAGLVYADKPLRLVSKELQAEYGIPILLDKPALDAASIRDDELVSVNLHGVSLKSALRHLLGRLNLTYAIDNEVLTITTFEELDLRRSLWVYDVRDLVDSEHGRPLDAITKTIDDTMTDLYPAVCVYTHSEPQFAIRAIKPGTIIAAMNQSAGETLRELISAIRELDRRPAATIARPPAPTAAPDVAPTVAK